ncbi:MAG: RDD family protein [Coriobacteriales bacterium]|nr:RDD family protein [Coriobacteriales bacterium]
MPLAAFCYECNAYTWVRPDECCAAGHPKSMLRNHHEVAGPLPGAPAADAQPHVPTHPAAPAYSAAPPAAAAPTYAAAAVPAGMPPAAASFAAPAAPSFAAPVAPATTMPAGQAAYMYTADATPSLNPAVMGRRAGALIIDSLIVYTSIFVITLAIGFSVAAAGGSLGSMGFGAQLMAVLAYFGYFIFFEGVFGATLGKLATGVRVVTVDGDKPAIGQVVARNLMRIVDGMFGYMVGFLVATNATNNQRWGDQAAGTMVVRSRGTAPYR